MNILQIKIRIHGVMILCMLAPAAFAEDAIKDAPIAENNVQVSEHVVEKISNEFSGFLGDNADAVVTGLREGSEITLTTTTTGTGDTPVVTETSFTPATGKMGYGNVSLSLALSQEQLNQYGITEPTADELIASLAGGDITTTSGGTASLDGVLALRSDGMGWGQIAQEYGIKLGHVISSIKSGKQHVLTAVSNDTNTGTTSTNTVSSSGKQSGITSGGGAQSNKAYKSSSKTKGYAYGKGIVSATGNSISSTSTTTVKGGGSGIKSNSGNAYGHGIVNAGGGAIGASGASKSQGLAKGHNK